MAGTIGIRPFRLGIVTAFTTQYRGKGSECENRRQGFEFESTGDLRRGIHPLMHIDSEHTPDYFGRMRLDGQVWVVLGGGDGIGRQTCLALHQAGASVVCVDVDEPRAKAVATEVDGLAYVADVTDRAQVEALFTEVETRIGPPKGLVDIVGMAILGHLSKVTDRDWSRQFHLVLDHAFLALQVGGAAIGRSGGGAMVFVGSNCGVAHIPDRLAYGTAKAALHHLVGSAARDLAASKVRVNAVAPGLTLTPRFEAVLDEEAWQRAGALIPRGYGATTAEIASIILFLASDMSSYVNGHTLVADGGLTGTTSSAMRQPAGGK
jgi:NAD(P)-dependent dehydrogenase (short-subunit alcohol dehydrogenase family)